MWGGVLSLSFVSNSHVTGVVGDPLQTTVREQDVVEFLWVFAATGFLVTKVVALPDISMSDMRS